MPFRFENQFNSCTATLDGAEFAPCQTVTLHCDDDVMSGTLDVPLGTGIPAADRPVDLFVPGHGPAHIHITGTAPGDPSSVRLRFVAAWLSPDLRAACSER